MQIIESTDGTDIAYERRGEGPPLVLVHGSAGHHVEWREVVPALAESFAVYAMDRRGRGESGDGPEIRSGGQPDTNASGGADEYAIEREYADVAAMVDHVAAEHDSAEPVSLLGSSYGAICSLHAILETEAVDRLVLYEPPLGDAPEPEGAAAGIEAQIEEEGAEAAVETFLRNALEMNDEEIEAMRGGDLWESRVDAMPALPREIRATQRDLFDPADFGGVSVPTTLLVGDESPARLQDATTAVADALEGSTVVTLEGQGHLAMSEVPGLFVEAVEDALTASAE